MPQLKTPLLVPVLVLLSLLSGCLIESKYVIGEIQSIDAELIGIWSGTDIAGEGDVWRLEIMAFNEKEYLIDAEITKPNETRHLKARALTTKIGTGNILHFQFLHPPIEERSYNYYQYQLLEGGLSLRVLKITDQIQQFQNQEDLENYIRQNLDNDKAWGSVGGFFPSEE